MEKLLITIKYIVIFALVRITRTQCINSSKLLRGNWSKVLKNPTKRNFVFYHPGMRCLKFTFPNTINKPNDRIIFKPDRSSSLDIWVRSFSFLRSERGFPKLWVRHSQKYELKIVSNRWRQKTEERVSQLQRPECIRNEATPSKPDLIKCSNCCVKWGRTLSRLRRLRMTPEKMFKATLKNAYFLFE